MSNSSLNPGRISEEIRRVSRQAVKEMDGGQTDGHARVVEVKSKPSKTLPPSSASALLESWKYRGPKDEVSGTGGGPRIPELYASRS